MNKPNINLNLLLSGQFVSQVGDRFYMIALSFMVLKTTGSTAMMGAVLAAALIPSVILGLVAGTFIDRFNRKIIIVGTDVLRGFIIIIVTIFYYFDGLSFNMILVSQTLLSINSAFFDPAVAAVIPAIVRERDLIKANSKHQFVNGFATIIGPAAGGLCVALSGYTVVFAVNAFSFFISAFFELFLKLPEKKNKKVLKNGFSEDLITGYRYIIASRPLMILLFMVGVIHFFAGYIEVFIPVTALMFNADGPQALGFFHTSFGTGTLFIAFLLSISKRSLKEQKSLFKGTALIGIVFILLASIEYVLIDSYLIYLPLFFVLGCSVIVAGVSFRTLLQKSVDDEVAGRIFGIAGSIANSSIPFAMILSGFLMEYISQRNLLYLCGSVLLPISFIAYRLYKGAENG